MLKLETGLLTVIWEQLLERFNRVSKILQTPGLDLSEGLMLLSSLETFVTNIRQN